MDANFIDSEGKLSQAGYNTLLLLLQAVRSQSANIPFSIWQELMRVGGKGVPVAIELAVVRKGMVFLCQRSKDDPCWPELWHLPGSYLGQAENVEATCRRIGQNEIGIEIANPVLIGGSDNPGNPRFHDFSVVYLAEDFAGEPTGGEWFKLADEPPTNLIKEHVGLWQVVKNA
ncbi:MAG: NUDIX hydrolase [Candidatus Buchananbacteria bacterium]